MKKSKATIIMAFTLLSLLSTALAANTGTRQHFPQHVVNDKFIVIGRSACSFYYKSFATATWPIAKDACCLNLGPNATLVNVETAYELQRIHTMLNDDFDGVGSYWVDAQWEDGCYRWMSSGECVDESEVIHWLNERTFGENKMTLMLMYRGKKVNLAFTGAVINNNVKFICEVPFQGHSHCNSPYK